jgi:hypothetical protein
VEGRLHPPITIVTPKFFHLPASMYNYVGIH